MLDNAGALHAEKINERELLSSWKVNLQHDGSVIVVVVPAKDVVFPVREDWCELSGDGVASLRIIWAVLDEVLVDVLVEGVDDLLVGVPESLLVTVWWYGGMKAM